MKKIDLIHVYLIRYKEVSTESTGHGSCFSTYTEIECQTSRFITDVM